MSQECSLNRFLVRILPERSHFEHPGHEATAGGYALGWLFSLGVILFALTSPLWRLLAELWYRISHGPVAE